MSSRPSPSKSERVAPLPVTGLVFRGVRRCSRVMPSRRISTAPGSSSDASALRPAAARARFCGDHDRSEGPGPGAAMAGFVVTKRVAEAAVTASTPDRLRTRFKGAPRSQEQQTRRLFGFALYPYAPIQPQIHNVRRSDPLVLTQHGNTLYQVLDTRRPTCGTY